jgi:hypothetical protein
MELDTSYQRIIATADADTDCAGYAFQEIIITTLSGKKDFVIL